jgi:hypothetical protein
VSITAVQNPPTLARSNHGSGHSYKLNGARVDGVTTLLGKGMPKPALIDWAARCVGEYIADADDATMATLRGLGRDGMVAALKSVPAKSRDDAAARGRLVHKLAERMSLGETVDVPEPLRGHVDSCLKFFDEWQPVVVLSETPVASVRWQYAGTLDLVADLVHGPRAILDYKTGRSGIFAETALQLAAYRHAEIYTDAAGAVRELADVGIETAYAVWLRADGFDVVPVDTSETVFRAFLHVAQVARITDTMRAWVSPAITPGGAS